MEWISIPLLVVVAILFIWNILYTRRKFFELKKPKEDQSFLIIKEDLESIRKSVENQLKLVDTRVGQVGNRFESATKEFTEVQKGLVKLEESSKRIYDIGKDIASLQEILKPPKLRGGLGELFLENLLSQILPKEYFTMQYKFRNGTYVDAVVHLKEALVSIDSKFPLENFKKMIEAETEISKKDFKKRFTRDVKKHIDDISNKYILPDEGTLDFALMYIPAENVYYETIVEEEASEEDKSIKAYAHSKKVFPVSPNTLYVYLMAIAKGLKGLRIEKTAEDIMNNLKRLNIDFEKFKNEFGTLGSHIMYSKSSYERAQGELQKFDARLSHIEGEKEKQDGTAL